MIFMFLTMALGGVVGLTLGLMGGGGTILAIPFLVYILDQSASQAVGISLATVGVTSLVGALERIWAGEADVGPALSVRLAGMMTAPVGTWIGRGIAPDLLMNMFVVLMFMIALRSWQNAKGKSAEEARFEEEKISAPACRYAPTGSIQMTSRCTFALVLAGLVVGMVSGLFGVGGGFIIVPALIFAAQMPVDRAVGTSLVVISMVSFSGLISIIFSRTEIPIAITVWFILGSLSGLYLGTKYSRKMEGTGQQKVFAVEVGIATVFMIVQNN
ncbi:MAG: sulfite exporter TauE/SafE family protein [Phycisphaeraceae bacterium]|nr:sulfite exporter TauE/SafE family protein [Phycisphaeraceae bacterium]